MLFSLPGGKMLKKYAMLSKSRWDRKAGWIMAAIPKTIRPQGSVGSAASGELQAMQDGHRPPQVTQNHGSSTINWKFKWWAMPTLL
jgi:hypothetical protein